MKLWGGRFEKSTDSFAEGFNSSIAFDSRMYKQDITGSIAHAKMLGKQGIITMEESAKIVNGLKDILLSIENGEVSFSVADEDIHMNIERLLIEKIGDTGKKLHTGRSRNDQVATDFRLYLVEEIAQIIHLLKNLQITITDIAHSNLETVMCAYTHLQKAQPTTLAHYIMAYFEMFYRDISRFKECEARTSILPLGSGALCGTTYPLDRQYVAEELAFKGVCKNSLDGVSDRDFAIEFLADASMCMMHLSRLCEELILFSTNEFGTVTMDDGYSTGSSIMPQKKNPDMAELIRGKTGRVYGSLTTLLTIMKGLPLAYNKDMQEDKECVFDTADTLKGCLQVMDGMLKTLKWNKEKMRNSAELGFTNATDAADYFVKKGIPFRDAHEIIGKLVLKCEKENIALSQLRLWEIQELCTIAEDDFYDAILPETCINARSIVGAPAPTAVLAHIEDARRLIAEF